MKLENAENPQEILFGDRTRKMALSTGIELRIHVEVKSFTSALKPLQTPINIFFSQMWQTSQRMSYYPTFSRSFLSARLAHRINRK